MYLCKLIMRVVMEKKVDTSIQFSGLATGIYEYDYRLDSTFFSQFENDDLRDCEVDYRVKLERKERLLVFVFNFSGQVKVECDRCLKMMEVPVKGEQTLYVKFGEAKESDDENVVFLPEGESKIDLAQWLYEFVAIEVPIVHSHPDDENGNPTCDPEMLKYISEGDSVGQQDSDPRWDALKALKDE